MKLHCCKVKAFAGAKNNFFDDRFLTNGIVNLCTHIQFSNSGTNRQTDSKRNEPVKQNRTEDRHLQKPRSRGELVFDESLFNSTPEERRIQVCKWTIEIRK